MPNDVNLYGHGFIAIPILEACFKHGLFNILDSNKYRDINWLIEQKDANKNELDNTLRMLVLMNVLETNKLNEYRLIRKNQMHIIDWGLSNFYSIDAKDFINNKNLIADFNKKVEELIYSNKENNVIDLLIGSINIIALSILVEGKLYNSDFELERDENGFTAIVEKLFKFQNLIEMESAKLKTEVVKYIESFEFSTLINAKKLLFSYNDKVFTNVSKENVIEFDSSIADLYSRNNNLKNDLLNEIVDIFNEKNISEQPTSIINVSCNDALFVDTIINKLHKNTLRGENLKTYPIKFISVTSLDDNLKKKVEKIEGLEYIAIPKENGDFIKVKSYLDSVKINKNDESLILLSLAEEIRKHKLVNKSDIQNEWRNQFTFWANNYKKSTFLVVEQHSVKSYWSLINKEDIYLDFLINLNDRSIIDSEEFVKNAANSGLLDQKPAKRYPKEKRYCNSSMHKLHKRDYEIRNAEIRDIEKLDYLEKECWKEELRSSKETIKERITSYPKGQFVLEKDGNLLGVIYSQRIENVDDLKTSNMDNVNRLHSENGSIIQLLAVNIDPMQQDLNLGDQLLEFMLQRSSMVNGISKIVAVTLCKKYQREKSIKLEDYIKIKGSEQDPILAFHSSHGASISNAIKNYRKRDVQNEGFGVLVEYDVHKRDRSMAKTNKIISHDITNEELETFIVEAISEILDIDKGKVGLERPLMEMGLNSADLLSFQFKLEEKLKLKLGSEFFFGYNTINKIINKVGTEDKNNQVDEIDKECSCNEKIIDDAETYEGDIAIIGMSCKLPGGIDTSDKLWELLSEGKSVIKKFPSERCPWPSSEDMAAIDKGGFLEDGDKFDEEFFRMSPSEAKITDPQQRILLELAWSCLEDAGILPEQIKGSNTGVFIGASNNDYSRLIQDSKIETEAHYAIGSSLAVLANRLSYFFDLSGPSLLIDTACSASMVALHSAVQNLKTQECSVAMVGGINFICHPNLSIAYHKAGMLSHDGKCKVFDNSANGYVRSEGGVMLLLKPLKSALKDKNQIHAVIKGSAVNHGGLAAGLTVPNPQKQSELLLSAWQNAKISPSSLSYIEAHGTGTSLGDPIEIQGIKDACGKMGSDESFSCGIGSIKSNMGHLEPAAGITGLLKIIVSLKNKMLPPTINFQNLNSKIEIKNTPFTIQNKLEQWDSTFPRTAGVSSFGSGGANAHVVVQEFKAEENINLNEKRASLFVLSAKNKERLLEYCSKVLEWLEGTEKNRCFQDAIYSWQVGRRAMDYRLAINVSSFSDLQRELKKYLNNDNPINTLWQTNENGKILDDDKLEVACKENDLEVLGKHWVSGGEINWSNLYNDELKIISIPTYPFAREKHWIEFNELDDNYDKQQDETVVPSTIYATPVWEKSENVTEKNINNVNQYIFFCGSICERVSDFIKEYKEGSCYLFNSNEKSIDRKYSEIGSLCFKEIKNLFKNSSGNKHRLLIVIDENDNILSGLYGLLKTANIENPSFSGKLVICNTELSNDELQINLTAEAYNSFGEIVKYKGQERAVKKWDIISEPSIDGKSPFKKNGVYIITGGLGNIGKIFTRSILDNNDDCVVILTGRSELKGKKLNEFNSIKRKSNNLIYMELDLDNFEDVSNVFNKIIKKYKKIDGIIHNAGMIAYNFIINKSTEEFNKVLSPKVTGTYNLDMASKSFKLDFFVLFSSISSSLESLGQEADYSIANGFLDQFSVYRNDLVLKGDRFGKTLSINWPLWQHGGMSIDKGSEELLKGSIGMIPMDNKTGIKTFNSFLLHDFNQVLVMEGFKEKILQAINGKESFSESISNDYCINVDDKEEILKLTLNKMKGLFGKIIKLSPDKIDSKKSFSYYGIDSIFINQLNVEMEKVFNGVSKTIFFEYQNLSDMTKFLIEDYTTDCAKWCSISAEKVRKEENLLNYNIKNSYQKDTCDEPIAIIGMNGIYPGASDLDQYWNNIKTGTNSITEIPEIRWSADEFYNSDKDKAVEEKKSYSKWGGFVDQFANFDPFFFGISPKDAMNIDPQERMFLQSAWGALENAGYTRKDLKEKFNQKVGVFAGITKSGYDLHGEHFLNDDEPFHPRTSFGSIANRLSYFLNITSPSIPIDTMCSSSLTAIHEACEHIKRGECKLAFAGGVNLYLHPSTYIWLSAQKMLSDDGKCRSFGDGGNGFVPGEGVGVFLLKPLSEAEKDKDIIHGVILSTNVNHGGKTNGYFVPSPNAHAELICNAVKKAGVNSRDISYIEAHGTGTELGDPIEINGLKKAFEKDTNDKMYCSIGSVKSNIGHLEAAAGIAGVTKVLLQMRNEEIAPSLHSEKINPNIDINETPFIVSQKLQSWENPIVDGVKKPRIAGISSFGAGGTNAHVIIQEYKNVTEVMENDVNENVKLLFPVSAKTNQQMDVKVQEILQYIRLKQDEVDEIYFLNNLSYTLQTCREQMDKRIVFVACSIKEIIDNMECYVNTKQGSDSVIISNVDADNHDGIELDSEKIIRMWLSNDMTDKLAKFWVEGNDFDWHLLYDGKVIHQKLELPIYPFAEDKYWIDSLSKIEKNSNSTGDYIHPLLQKNDSDFYEQKYYSVFNGTEDFIINHKGSGIKELPEMVSLQMILCAVKDAKSLKNDTFELDNVVWGEPIIINENRKIVVNISENNKKEISFEIISRDIKELQGSADKVHCQGNLITDVEGNSNSVDLTKIVEKINLSKTKESEIYDLLETKGVEYKTKYKVLNRISSDNDVLFAKLILSGKEGCLYDNFSLLLESIVQTSQNQKSELQKDRLITWKFNSLRYINCKNGSFYVQLNKKSIDKLEFDADIFDENGKSVLSIKNLCFKRIKADSSSKLDNDIVLDKIGLNEIKNECKPIGFYETWENSEIRLIEDELNKKLLIMQKIKEDSCFSSKMINDISINDEVVVSIGKKYEQISANKFTCRAFNYEDFEKTFNCLNKNKENDFVIIYEWSMGEKEAGIHGILDLFRTIKTCNLIVSKVILIGSDDCWDQSWIGIERTLKLIVPEVELTIALIENKNVSESIIKDALRNNGIIKYKSNKRYVLSYKQLDLPVLNNLNAFKHNGCYLITGGCGGIGFNISKYLAKNYNAKLVLIGRRKTSDEIKNKISELNDLGSAKAEYFSVDICNKKNMLEFSKKISVEYSGIIHAAGIEDNRLFYEKSKKEIDDTLNPKISGTILLDEYLNQNTLDFVCYFSSLSAIIGDFGSCDYSIANRFQMAYAEYRNNNKKLNGKAYVINWPLWLEGGMTPKDKDQVNFYLKTSGQEALDTEEGINLWNRLLCSDFSQSLVLKGYQEQIIKFLNNKYFYEEVENSTEMQDFSNIVLEGCSIKESLTNKLQSIISTCLKIKQDKIDNNVNLADFGFDSIGLSSFAKALSNLLEDNVSPAIFFSYSTVNKLNDFLMSEYNDKLQALYKREKLASKNNCKNIDKVKIDVRPKLTQKNILKKNSAAIKKNQELIAIVGMSGRFPKANSVNGLWDLLKNSESGISEIPSNRWNWKDYYTSPGNSKNIINTNKAGFIEGVKAFDPIFFGVSPREALEMDPAERLLLIEAYRAIEDAGISPLSLQGENVGVFVGMEESEYGQISEKQGVTTAGNAMISSRLSYFLDLHGPTLSINTACSSGLVALHQAMKSIQNGECDSALAAGISLFLSPRDLITMSKAGMLSEDGKCHTFSQDANGIGVGEAVAVIMLKPLSEALKSGDVIYGTIKASGINFDGKTNGVTAPNGKMQEELIEKIYTENDINVKDVNHIVAHGTGTKLGDPVEVMALTNIYKKLSKNDKANNGKSAYCALTSCKSNIGHTMAASGIVSVISLLLGMKNNTIPASINCEKENEYLSIKDSPFFVNKETAKWQNEKSLIGAVSAFGRSGTNAHMVIEEYSDDKQRDNKYNDAEAKSYLILLSARTEEQLFNKAEDLISYASNLEDCNLEDVAYTLQVGRDQMRMRKGFVIESKSQLLEQLKSFCYEKNVKFNENIAKQQNKTLSNTELNELLETYNIEILLKYWINGLDIDWNKLYPTDTPKKVSLPTYPFGTDEYWLEQGNKVNTEKDKPLNHLEEPFNLKSGNSDKRSEKINLDTLDIQYDFSPISGSNKVKLATLDLEEYDGFGKGKSFDNSQERKSILLENVKIENLIEGHIDRSISKMNNDINLSKQNELLSKNNIQIEDLQDLLIEGLAEALYMDTSEIEMSKSFTDMGLDSIIGVEWVKGINKQYGINILSTEIYNYPTVLEFSEYLYNEMNKHSVQENIVKVSDSNYKNNEHRIKISSDEINKTNNELQIEDLQDQLIESLAEALYMDTSDIEMSKSFTDMGLDSIIGVEWVKEINKNYSVNILSTEIYNYPTIAEFSQYLLNEISKDSNSVNFPENSIEVISNSTQNNIITLTSIEETGKNVSLEEFQDQLIESLAEALYMNTSDIELSKSFTDMGLDSIIGVEWVKGINKQYGINILSTEIYNYPTINELSEYLLNEIGCHGNKNQIIFESTQEKRIENAINLQNNIDNDRTSINVEELQTQLIESLSEALFMNVSDIEVTKSFTDMGLDSIIGVEWIKEINEKYNININSTEIYNYPNISEITEFILSKLQDNGFVGLSKKEVFNSSNELINKCTDLNKDEINYKKLKYYSSNRSGDFTNSGRVDVRHIINLENSKSLKEHLVFNEYVFPTDAFIELVYTSAITLFNVSESICLQNVTIVNPLVGKGNADIFVRVIFSKTKDNGVRFSVVSSYKGFEIDEQVHFNGFVSNSTAMPIAEYSIGKMNSLEEIDIRNYLPYSSSTIKVGDFYKSLKKLFFGSDSAFGHIMTSKNDGEYLLTPSIIISGFATVMNYGPEKLAEKYHLNGDAFLPYKLDNVNIYGPMDEEECYCYAKLKKIESDFIELYFEILDSSYNVRFSVDNIRLQRVSEKSLKNIVMRKEQTKVIDVVGKSNNKLNDEHDVAIIGISCRYPGSKNSNEFWNTLKNGIDCISEIPENRWVEFNDWYHPDPDHQFTADKRRGGLLEDIDKFDEAFFNISPFEAELMDPQQRVFLEEAWRTIEDAGYAPNSLNNSKCGVYVGCAASDYSRVLSLQSKDKIAQAFPGNNSAILAARIAYFLNLKGPAISIDTACSSSLTAIHIASESIRKGENELALAGGVSLTLTPLNHILTSQFGMQSKQGVCATFDKSADGTVFSEGCGVVLLKSLDAAQRDGDNIIGVIKGSDFNQDGKTNGITAPNSISQEKLLFNIYEKFGINPEDIGYVEAHGTATPLGDPIEVNALIKAFQRFTNKKNNCAIGSIKTNIGHSGYASGVAGLIKLLLCMKNESYVPSLHYKEANENIDFNNSPFYVNTEYKKWNIDPGKKRLATVSSFGFSGTNVHMVVEEYKSSIHEDINNLPKQHIIPLSAKDNDSLKSVVEQLYFHVKDHNSNNNSVNQNDYLSNLAYTLQVGRDGMEERLSLIVDSMEDLEKKLLALINGEKVRKSYKGNTKDKNSTLSLFTKDEDLQDAIKIWVEKGKHDKIAELWTQGLVFDWHIFYKGNNPKRVSLPTYPFKKESHWIDNERINISKNKSEQNVSYIHPLLHLNTSNLLNQSYRSTFTGDEFYFSDHQVFGKKMLPGVAYIEMILAAVKDACPDIQDDIKIEVKNVIWINPVIVIDKVEVTTILSLTSNEEISFEIFSNTNNGEKQIHCQGEVCFRKDIEISKLDIDNLKRDINGESFESEFIYSSLKKIGLEYGLAHQGISNLKKSDSQVIADIYLPQFLEQSFEHYTIHPSLMDSSLQAGFGIIADLNNLPEFPPLPFAMESMEIVSDLNKEMYSWVRFSENPDSNNVKKIDVDMCDKDGDVCIRIRGFSSRILNNESAISNINNKANVIEHGVKSLVPVWTSISNKLITSSFLSSSSKILLLSNVENHGKWIKEVYPNLNTIDITNLNRVEDIANAIKANDFEHLVWIASDVDNVAKADENNSIIADQESGVILLFRIIKSLFSLGYENKNLNFSIITSKTQKVKESDTLNPKNAAVFGLIGCLSKEMSHWNINLIDVDNISEVNVEECLNLSHDKGGDGIAIRDKEWFVQSLAETNVDHDNEILYKQNGVYIVIGGAGGLGEVWTKYMVDKYNADVIWIGRRELNDDIKVKLEVFNNSQKQPLYISADASNEKSLIAALSEVNKRFPKINGIIHSAIILQDQSLRVMDEQKFKQSLAAKVDISIQMEKVFGKLDLDFMLFFSSSQTFIKAAGQSNYAAGCTFKDCFAKSLQERYKYPIKIVNWGFWGSIGIVADEFYKRRIEEFGIGSIEPDEGMQILEKFMSSYLNQIAPIKTINMKAYDYLNISDKVSVYPSTGDSKLNEIKSRASKYDSKETIVFLDKVSINNELIKMSEQITKMILLSMNLNTNNKDYLSNSHGERSYLGRWIESSIKYLFDKDELVEKNNKEKNYSEILEKLWKKWDLNKDEWCTDLNQKAKVELLEVCLKSLPQIINGKMKATDVMFPNSSMELVEGIYNGNELADFYNEVLGNNIKIYLEELIKTKPNYKIRILEIGAGTGGTTVKLLPILKLFEEYIEEYCYTDMSKAFLLHAEEKYQPEFPALKTEMFNVAESLKHQNINENYYDIVIATNVLHATPNIRVTLRNTKAAMKKNATMFLNEISNWSLFTHLTFGLLEGWWLHEDSSIRIAGSPGIEPDKWKQILPEEGFQNILFPTGNSDKYGQQIIVAESNGVVRQIIDKEDEIIEEIEIFKVPKIEKYEKIVEVTKDNSSNVNEACENYVKKLIAKTLKMNVSKIDSFEPLEKYGLDSILVVQLTNTFRAVFPEVTSTLFFEVQNVNGLVKYLLDNMYEELMSVVSNKGLDNNIKTKELNKSVKLNEKVSIIPTASVTNTARFYTTKNDQRFNNNTSSTIKDVAIIGLSGRYPKSKNLNEFWQNLSNGKNCISEIPKERWQWQDYFDSEKGKEGKIYTKWGGFLTDIDKFDPLFFRISPKEAKKMDPQERLFLESCYHAMEDAGYTPDSIGDNEKIGVFVGVMNSRYSTQPNYFSIANRVSFLFDFQGPSLAVDTACSSSLSAIHLALESIYSGMSECAIAGGVNLIIDAAHYQKLSSMTMLSEGKECKAFGENADGFVDAEGVGTIILKSLEKAEADGDNIYGVIKGSAMNAGGRTNGYTVPNPKAQANVIKKAMERANVSADQISYIEAHGTGTALGDPIEVAALTNAFKEHGVGNQYCSLGSVKSNIGHTESAAGIAGLTKVLLQLKNKQVVPTLNVAKTNPEINFNKTPFKIQEKLEEWKRPVIESNGVKKEGLRIAGISSFGAGGANSHIIVQEYVGNNGKKIIKNIKTTEEFIVPLSAKTESQLKKKVTDLLSFLRNTDNRIEMNQLAYTLQLGREPMNFRIAVIVNARDELIIKLQDFLDEKYDVDGLFKGNIKDHRETISLFNSDQDFNNVLESWIKGHKFIKLVDLWVKGLTVDWRYLYDDNYPNRISLPHYPFEGDRYWALEKGGNYVSSSTIDFVHPLLQFNKSDFNQYCYMSKINGQESFLNQNKSIPVSFYFEMARAALINMNSNLIHDKIIVLNSIEWIDSFQLKNEIDVFVALCETNKNYVEFEIYNEENGDDNILCQGHALVKEKQDKKNHTYQELKMINRYEQVDMERLILEGIYKNKTYFNVIKNIYRCNDNLLFELNVSEKIKNNMNNIIIHPELIEDVFLSSIDIFNNGRIENGFIKYAGSVESIAVLSPLVDNMFVVCKLGNRSDLQNGNIVMNIEFYDMDGNTLLEITGIEFSFEVNYEDKRNLSKEYLATNSINKETKNDLVSVEDYDYGNSEILPSICEDIAEPKSLGKSIIKLSDLSQDF